MRVKAFFKSTWRVLSAREKNASATWLALPGRASEPRHDSGRHRPTAERRLEPKVYATTLPCEVERLVRADQLTPLGTIGRARNNTLIPTTASAGKQSASKGSPGVTDSGADLASVLRI